MKDLGRVFGCVERCFILSQTMAGHSVYQKCFYLENLQWAVFLTLAIWGMRLYKRNVRLCEVSFICLQTISEHENPETDIDTFCT